ncbi:MAG: 16S rRNA pseudouridine(516) synthase RsuA [Succinivibrionaceae bacterium]
MRLDKCITVNYGYSRKEASKIIRKGIVKVNGNVVKDSAFRVSEKDLVTCDGDDLIVITAKHKRYFALYKPTGYVCANEDSLNPIVFSLLERDIVSGLFCVGRLDLDTEGLLLITDDGDWAHRITSPKHHCEKTYEVTLAEPCADDVIEIFNKGILLNNEKHLTKPARLKIITSTLVHLTISEGKYHQVKRMFAAVGNKVIALKRLSIGSITLDNLEVGAYRELTQEEIEEFNVQ